MIPTRIESTLTGRTRARPGWFGKQIMQVEVSRQHYSLCPPPPGRKDDAAWREFAKRGEPVRAWIDATWEDVQALQSA